MAKRVLIVDSGKEWGGGTNSLLLLVQNAPPHWSWQAAFYHNYQQQGKSIAQTLQALQVDFHQLPAPHLSVGFKWLRELRVASRAWCEWHGKWHSAGTQLANLVRQVKPDLLYANNHPDANIPVYLAAQTTGITLVQHVRKISPISPRVAALVNAQAHEVICVSQDVLQHVIASGIDAPRCRVIPNGLDVTQTLPDPRVIRQRYGLYPEHFVLACIGSLLPLKHVAHLLTAIARAKAEHWRCLIVGSGPLTDALQAQAQALGIAPQVIFTGFQADALAFIQASDCVVSCSAGEGLPRVLLEAMLCRKAIVASDVSGSRELIANPHLGCLYPFADIPALTQTLQTVASDANLRQRLGEAAHAHVVRHYPLQRYIDDVFTCLENACGLC